MHYQALDRWRRYRFAGEAGGRDGLVGMPCVFRARGGRRTHIVTRKFGTVESENGSGSNIVAERTHVLYHLSMKSAPKGKSGDTLGAIKGTQTDDRSKPAWGNRQLNTVNAILDAIQHLDMPRPSSEFIRSILKSAEWEKFKAAVEDCLQLNNRSASIETKRYLFGVVSCASADIRDKLEDIGYSSVPDAILLHIGKTNGMHFRGAVIAAATAGAHNQETGLDLVAECINAASKATGAPISSGQGVIKKAAAAPATASTDSDAGSYRSAHVYGSGAAFCFNASTTRTDHYSIMVDAAGKKPDGEADWASAIKIQLDHKELPLLYGVLVGWSNTVKFGAHGKSKEKSLEIVRQEGHFYLKVMSRGSELRSVQMSGEDSFHVVQLALAQIVRESPAELRARPDIIIHLMKESHFIRPVLANGKESKP